MKGFICEKYGPPETLGMAEVEKPAPDAGEVLVRVLAISVNPADWHSMRGKPLFSRATLGLWRPKHKILGGDIAGQVEAVGNGVTQFKPGDEVYANLPAGGLPVRADFLSALMSEVVTVFEKSPPVLLKVNLQDAQPNTEVWPPRPNGESR